MLILLIQVVGAILTAFIALILLRKDPRITTEAIRKEALLIRSIIIAVTAVSILNLAISNYIAQTEKRQLIKDQRDLKADNENLKSELLKNTEEQSRLIAYQKQSARQLTNAANNLQHIINGSKQVPLFRFVMVAKKNLLGTIVNKDYKPVYSLYIKLTNYDNLLQCKTKKAGTLVVDLKCFVKNTFTSPMIPSLNGGSTYYLKLPRLSSKAEWGRYMAILTINKKSYIQEAVYNISKKHGLVQALRVIEYENNTVVRKTLIKSKDYTLQHIKWDKAFPLPLDLRLKKL